MTVRLAMLARDEADRMAGVAEACGHLVDDYCVLVDDRSRDGTPEAVWRALGSRGRCEGFVFEDFAQARNALFAAAREGLGVGDYLLLVDPDSPPHGEMPELGAPLYDCTWRSGPYEWRLPILVAADLACEYVGACHESLAAACATLPAPGLTVDVLAKAFTPERQESYVELLSRDAATNPRSAFYLAQALRELGRTGAAIEAYLRRAQMGHGWVEETFMAVYEAGCLMLPLDVELARCLLERASRFRPTRIEPLVQLAWLANAEQRHDDATDLALAALALPPSDDSLFVNRHLERDGAAIELHKARAATATRMEPDVQPLRS